MDPSVCTDLALDSLVCIDGGGVSATLRCSPTVICGQHICGEQVEGAGSPPWMIELPDCDEHDLEAVVPLALALAPSAATVIDLEPAVAA